MATGADIPWLAPFIFTDDRLDRIKADLALFQLATGTGSAGQRNLVESLLACAGVAGRYDLPPVRTWVTGSADWGDLHAQGLVLEAAAEQSVSSRAGPRYQRNVPREGRLTIVARLSEQRILSALIDPHDMKPPGQCAPWLETGWYLRTLLASALLAGTSQRDAKRWAADIGLLLSEGPDGERAQIIEDIGLAPCKASGLKHLVTRLQRYRLEQAEGRVQEIFCKRISELAGFVYDAWLDDEPADEVGEVTTRPYEIASPSSLDETVTLHGYQVDEPGMFPGPGEVSALFDDPEPERVERAHERRDEEADEIRRAMQLERMSVPWSGLSFTVAEEQELERRIAALFDSDDWPVALLMQLLSEIGEITLPGLLELTYGKSGNITPQGYYEHLFVMPDNAKVPAGKTNAPQRIPVQLSQTAISYLKKLGQPRQSTLGELLGLSVGDARKKIDAVLKAMRKDGWRRVYFSHLEHHLAHAVGIACRDPAKTFLLASRADHRPPAVTYYASVLPSRLVLQCSPAVAFQSRARWTPGERYGALTMPDLDELVQTTQSLYQHTCQQMKQGNLVQAHNAFVAWCAIMIMVGVASREVSDAVSCRFQVDEEQGLCLLSDKLISDGHEWRLVKMPRLVCKQFKQLVRHLNELLRELNTRNRYAMVSAIRQTLAWPEEAVAGPVPLLFFLDEDLEQTYSVTPTRLRQHLGDLWPYELNVGRVLTSSMLDDLGVARDVINVQMGHLDVFSQPFGKDTAWIPAQVFEELGGMLDQAFEAQGWQIIKARKSDRLKGKDVDADTAGVHETDDFGPLKRIRLHREQMWKDRHYVNRLVEKHVDELEDGTAVERLVKQEFCKGTNRRIRVNTRFYLFRKKLWRMKRSNPKIYLPKHRQFITDEPSPFQADFLLRYRQASRLQSGLADYIKARAKDTKVISTPAHHAALIVMFAALHDGQCRAGHLELIARFGDWTLKREGQYPFVDLHKTSKGPLVGRWHPGKQALDALGGLYHHDGATTVSVKRSELNQALKSILKACGSEVKRTPVRGLSLMASAYWQYHLPGMLYAIVSGQVPNQVLPTTTLIRLLRSECLVPEADDAQRFHLVNRLPLPSRIRQRADVGRADDFSKTIRRCLSRAARSPGRSQKSTLAREVKKLAKTPLFSAGAAIATWAYWLSTQKTFHENKIKFSTIDSYIGIVLKHILPHARQVNFLNLEANEYEALYLKILAKTKASIRADVAGRIAEFHWFLTRYWKRKPIDYTILPTRQDDHAVRIHANLVSYHEYQLVLDALSQREDLNDWEKTICQGLAILGYRYRLRHSDAIILQPGDLQLDNEGNIDCVSVQPNRKGKLKSIAAKRLSISLGPLTQREHDTLMVLREHALSFQSVIDEQYLFSEHDHAGRLVNGDRYVNTIIQVMRMVTGDPDLDFHGLRHSGVNNDYALILPQIPGEDEDSLWNVLARQLIPADLSRAQGLSRLSGHEGVDSRTLVSQSIIHGHANVASVYGSYWHMADCWLAHITHAHPRKKVMQYVTGYLKGKTAQAHTQELYYERKNKAKAKPRSKHPLDWITQVEITSQPYPEVVQYDRPLSKDIPLPGLDELGEIIERTVYSGLSVSNVISGEEAIEPALAHVIEQAVAFVEQQGRYRPVRQALDQPGRDKGSKRADANIHFPVLNPRMRIRLVGIQDRLKDILGERHEQGQTIAHQHHQSMARYLYSNELGHLDQLLAGLLSWERVYRPGKRYWRFYGCHELETFIRGLVLLGFDGTEFQLSDGISVGQDMLDCLEQLGITISERFVQRRNRPRKRLADDPCMDIEMTMGKGINTKHINYLLYLVDVYLGICAIRGL